MLLASVSGIVDSENDQKPHCQKFWKNFFESLEMFVVGKEAALN